VQTPEQITAYLQTLRQAGDVDLPRCPLVGPLWESIPPQRVGVVHLLARTRMVLADDVGTGKTPQALVAFGHLRHHDPTFRAIILVPLSVQFQWLDAVEKFLPGTSAEVIGAERTPRGRWKDLNRDKRDYQYARFSRGETSILIGTYNALALDFRTSVPATPGGKARYVWTWPTSWSPFVLVLDECHLLRNSAGHTLYPATASLIAASRYAWAMSATLISNRPEDIYNLFAALRPGTFSNKAEFQATYLTRRLKTIRVRGGGKRQVWDITGTQNLGQLADIIRPYVLRRTAAEVGKFMPGLRVQTLSIPMKADQSKLYAQALKASFSDTITDTGYATATRLAEAFVDERRGQSKAHVKVAKSAAVTYAQLAVDCPEVLGHPTVSNAKLDECLRLLMGELGNTSTIIYTRYAQVATAVHAALEQAGVKVALITGDVSASQRRTRQLAFQRGDVQVMVLTSSGREGLDLQTASCVIFYDLPWSHMEFTQVMGRARRIGSAHSRVTLLLLGTLTNHLAPTIDAMVLERLKRKSLIVEDVFGSTVLEAELKTASLMPVSDSVTDTDELNTTTAGTPPPVASATAADDSGASLVEGSDIDALFAALQAWGESPTA
jgi:hypothetical protein